MKKFIMAIRNLCFFTVVVALISTSYSNPIGLTGYTLGKTRFNEYTQELNNNTAAYIQRMEKIKFDILSKLGLDKPPVADVSRSQVPQALLADVWQMTEAEHEGTADKLIKKKVFIVGKLERAVPCGQNRCILVHFKNTPSNLDIKSTQLWFFKKNVNKDNISFMKLYNTDKITGHRQILIRATRLHQGEGWFVVKVKTKRITEKNKDGKIYVDLEALVECNNCKFSLKTAEQPFLSFSTVTKIQKRNKRSADENCSNGKSCCRKSLKVDFKAIGWDNWVLAPDSYDAFHCDGDCASDTSFHYQHTGIVKAVAKTLKRNDIKQCCTPRKHSSLVMLYISDGNLIRRIVDNMIVDECWCT